MYTFKWCLSCLLLHNLSIGDNLLKMNIIDLTCTFLYLEQIEYLMFQLKKFTSIWLYVHLKLQNASIFDNFIRYGGIMLTMLLYFCTLGEISTFDSILNPSIKSLFKSSRNFKPYNLSFIDSSSDMQEYFESPYYFSWP